MVVVNFFFIHAKWLTNRQVIIDNFKRNISKFHFKTINVGKIEVIEEMDPNDISAEVIQKHVDYNQVKEPNLAVYNNFLKNLHVFQLSNCLKHFKVYEKILQQDSEEEQINIVLEDDILYEERVFINLDKVIRELPVNFDLLFLGLPTNNDVKNKSQIKFQNTSEVFRVLPYCDSYIISKEAAKKLHDNAMPYKFLTNIQLSYLIEKLQLKSQLVVPNIFMDGSKYGTQVSSLNPNNTLMFNNDYNLLKNIIGKPEVSAEDAANAKRLFQSSSALQHPDFGYLKAQYLTKMNKFDEARDCYEENYNKYKSLNCVLNHESYFLKDYIRIFKHLQTDLPAGL